MDIHHIRHACMILTWKDHRILVDPCLSPKGHLPPYALFRERPRLNPLVDLPEGSDVFLDGTTAGLITHCRNGHLDHLDKKGIRLFAEKGVPVYCNAPDAAWLRRRSMDSVPLVMERENQVPFGTIIPVPARHGHGLIGWLMGKGAGYVIRFDEGPVLYLAGDTVLTDTVRQVLAEHQPDISVINAGTAVLDLGRPILMTLAEQLSFIEQSPGRVVAVHQDAFNHCRTTRAMLSDAVEQRGLKDKVFIPRDGEILSM
jgi:L-ascorbate metabolism protein UlaG (beta-lactamase superfamily)